MKMAKAKLTVDGYVAALPAPQNQTVAALRKLIRSAAPQLEETIKWGCPCYVGAANVCSIMAFKSHVNVAFFQGAKLADKASLLEGTGKGMRHVTVRSLKDLPTKKLAALVKQAAAAKA